MVLSNTLFITEYGHDKETIVIIAALDHTVNDIHNILGK